MLAAWAQATSITASRLLYVEARSVAGRLGRETPLTPMEVEALRSEFETRWAAISIVEIDGALADRAADLAETLLITGADAIHLASALAVRDRSDEPIIFAAFDDRLRAAARAERLATLPA